MFYFIIFYCIFQQGINKGIWTELNTNLWNLLFFIKSYVLVHINHSQFCLKDLGRGKKIQRKEEWKRIENQVWVWPKFWTLCLMLASPWFRNGTRSLIASVLHLVPRFYRQSERHSGRVYDISNFWIETTLSTGFDVSSIWFLHDIIACWTCLRYQSFLRCEFPWWVAVLRDPIFF